MAQESQENNEIGCVYHHIKLMERQDAMVHELKAISTAMSQLVTQQAEERRELWEDLRGKAPRHYIPLSVYYITVSVALGVSQATNIAKMLWGQQ